MREFLQWREGDAIILAEANVLPENRHGIFRRWRRSHAHDVQLPGQPEPCSTHWRPPIRGRWSKRCNATRTRPPTAQWGMFLRNHDELDLGRLTEEQRETVFEAFGPEPGCNSTSAASAADSRRCCNGDRRRLELAYSLMFTLPGTPVIRYGDEIGMGDDLRSAGANCGPNPDAMVDRTTGGIHKASGRSSPSSRRTLWISSTSTSPRNGAIRIRC